MRSLLQSFARTPEVPAVLLSSGSRTRVAFQTGPVTAHRVRRARRAHVTAVTRCPQTLPRFLSLTDA